MPSRRGQDHIPLPASPGPSTTLIPPQSPLPRDCYDVPLRFEPLTLCGPTVSRCPDALTILERHFTPPHRAAPRYTVRSTTPSALNVAEPIPHRNWDQISKPRTTQSDEKTPSSTPKQRPPMQWLWLAVLGGSSALRGSSPLSSSLTSIGAPSTWRSYPSLSSRDHTFSADVAGRTFTTETSSSRLHT